jgi:hypothetical protein
MSHTVLICDDDPDRSRDWAGLLTESKVVPSDYSVEALSPEDVVKGIEQLEGRRASAREGGDCVHPGDALFDRADVLVLDFDLFGLDRRISVTGEDVAYLARCYSLARVIVGLNQFGENPFDLTLVDHPESYADLNIGGNQLSNPSLWSAEPPVKHGPLFRPWLWPSIPQLVDAIDRRRKDILDAGPTKDIYEFLEMPDKVRDLIPRSVAAFLEGRNQGETLTFADVALTSGIGLRGNDKSFDGDEGIARISASRVSAWLENFLLSGEDILVDAPHLALRFPSLLGKDADPATANSWNATTTLAIQSDGGLDASAIQSARFRHRHWLSRPAWYWHLCADSPAIKEVADPWAARSIPFVFCEDVSQFLPPSASREFVAFVDSPYVRRYAVDPPNAPAPLKEHLREVEYVPQVRFALA